MAISPLPLRRLPILTTALLILIGLILLTIISLASDTGQRLVAQLASRALSSPASRVSIGRLEGLISPDITIRDIALADREGAWLYVDGVRIRWKPLALLRFRLSIDTLDVDRVEVFRKPVSNANETALRGRSLSARRGCPSPSRSRRSQWRTSLQMRPSSGCRHAFRQQGRPI
jgi:autotransporter translocation and assembly factor TamB